MKRQLLVLSALILSMPLWVSGQQAPQYSLYAFNPHAYNPAYSGLAPSLEAAGLRVVEWRDTSSAVVASANTQTERVRYGKLGVALIAGADMGERVANSGRSLAEGRLANVMILAEKI